MFHSYQGQDQFVVAACGGQRGGFFLDSGASDGLNGSNSLMLERDFGWRGICVEPNDALYAKLVANRLGGRSICLNYCLYDRDGEVAFLEAAEVYGGILQEYEPDHLDFARAFVARKAGGSMIMDDPTTSVLKRARRIEDVLRSCRAPRVIDYWSLDTEGSELAILRSFPFADYRVRFLTVEHNHAPIRQEIADFLTGQGFRRVVELGIDDGYAWAGHSMSAGWRSRAWSRTAS